ncbi:MAG: HAMP domain-containing histidine kinase [Desulfamplus sp.]|nr:HAMP domain-containing histidine kinase [Desulfamplus sp.]MBF0242422.1 HAMP domain-containing histidine kinase [Desulfamplus sp.]MBF0390257.1 HAMP domain-containing histidine kinase [Desulfamplus sp.]
MNGQIESKSSSGLPHQAELHYHYAGLQYFGSMSASIAHEIKNALAITNENAGLMEDLGLMVIKNGQTLDPERIIRLSRKVMEQVKRADNIVKKMSRFAHSVDDPVKMVNICEVVELTLDLGRRPVASYNITLEPVLSDSPISTFTNPFLLMNLLWLVIQSACKRVNSDRKIEVSVSKSDKDVNITIGKLISCNSSCQRDDFPQMEIIKLADSLNADVDDSKESRIVITVSPLTK